MPVVIHLGRGFSLTAKPGAHHLLYSTANRCTPRAGCREAQADNTGRLQSQRECRLQSLSDEVSLLKEHS
jgi:hypothetical protein